MGIQMTIPFTVLENGSVSTESDPNVQVAQRVDALIGTELGTRPMRANMGLALASMLFQPASMVIEAELIDKVNRQLTNYEPGVKAVKVTPQVDQTTGGVASINVSYTPLFPAAKARAVTDVITISVGGTVTDVTANSTI